MIMMILKKVDLDKMQSDINKTLEASNGVFWNTKNPFKIIFFLV